MQNTSGRLLLLILTIYDQCSYHMEASQLIYNVSKETPFLWKTLEERHTFKDFVGFWFGFSSKMTQKQKCNQNFLKLRLNFLWKFLAAFRRLLLLQKSSILDVCQSPHYVPANYLMINFYMFWKENQKVCYCLQFMSAFVTVKT